MLSKTELHNDSAAAATLSAWSRRAWVATLPDVAKTALPDERAYRKKLGAALVQLRGLNEGKSAAWLAEAVGRSEAAISRWETGKATPSAYDLRRVALAFKLPADALDVLLFPPDGPVSPVAERLAAAAAAGTRKGLVRLVRQRGDE